MVGKTEVRVPTSKIKQTVAEQLVKNGYLVSAVVEDGKPRGTLVVTINKDGETPTFTELSRMSKPGRRMYANVTDIPNVKQGRGIVLISTSRGVMTGREAIKQRLGGELLLKVY
jgi:small subunit ribosomal protein S8